MGAGFDLVFLEKSCEYFLPTRALWKLSKVNAAIASADLPIRFDVISEFQMPMISLSVMKGGHFLVPLVRTRRYRVKIKTSTTKP